MIINLLKQWKKQIIVVASIIIISLFTLFSNNSKNIKVKREEKLSKVEEKNINISKENNIYVDIKGAVVTPGVYEMTKTSRVIDVINLAGGLREDANTSNLNLSKKVIDEMYIIVYTNDEINSYLTKSKSSKDNCISTECICPNSENDACITKNSKDQKNEEKISINNATKEELMSLSGIGEAKANAIIKYREENGNFNKLEDIKNVSGISDNIYEKIKDNIQL